MEGVVMDMNPEEFSNLPPEEQTEIFKNLIMDLSMEERKILKIIIDNERQNHSQE